MADKLPAAPAFNNPPTKARPTDPNRFQSIDVLPEHAKNDPEYQKMVSQIEALQQRQGWLAGRGAMDKDDYMYLQDKEQEQRHTEIDQRDQEAAAYAAARARVEQQQQAATRASLKQPSKLLSKLQSKTTTPLAAVVKVKTHHSREQQQQQPGQPYESLRNPGPGQSNEPDPKKPRLGSSRAEAAEAAAAATAQVGGGETSSADAVGRDEGPPAGSKQQSHSTTGGLQDPAAQQAASDHCDQPGEGKDNGAAAARLEGLLAVYGSESENGSDDDGDDHGAGVGQQQGPAARSEMQQQQQQQRGLGSGRLQLPSAADLLEQELCSSFPQGPQQSLAEEGRCPDGSSHAKHGASAPSYQVQTGWI